MVYQAVKSDGWDRDRRQAQPDGRMRCGVNRWASLYGVSNKREAGCPALRLTASRHVGLVPVPFGTRCTFKNAEFFSIFQADLIHGEQPPRASFCYGDPRSPLGKSQRHVLDFCKCLPLRCEVVTLRRVVRGFFLILGGRTASARSVSLSSRISERS